MRRYLKVWYLLTINSFSTALFSRLGAILFLLGKILRFLFFLGFLVILVSQTKVLAGYTIYQVVFFFLTFNLIDTLAQLFFREVYRFRPKVVRGDFDLDLVKPISPLFKALAGGADPLDLFMLIPHLGILLFVVNKLSINSPLFIFLFLFLLFNSFFIATGFHILVLSLGILTTEVDHSIMIYRDLTQMGRVPIDIYQQPVRALLTFVIPVGIMMTFPVKALMGLLSVSGVIVSFIFGLGFFFFSLFIWRYSLTQYASASS